jgi:uncharacterized protein (DUF849 family)
MEEFVLNFAPTGLLPRRPDHPDVPLDPAEIAEQVLAAASLGATVAHLHAREEDGSPSSRAEVFADIIGRIRAHDRRLVLCVSLSGRFVAEFGARAAPLALGGDLKPDMASLTLSSLNFSRSASVTAPDDVKELAGRMLECGVVPEFEVFDLGMANYLRYLLERGLVEAPCYANLILGNVATAQADLASAGLLVRELPAGCLWSMGGIGASQVVANTLALASGGGVRVGLEDNLYYDAARAELASNRVLVDRVIAIASMLGRRPMPPATFRKKMAMLAGDGHYGREPKPRMSP